MRRGFIAAACAALVVASAVPVRAEDVVTLKSGRVLEGVVDDRGEYIIVTCSAEGGVTGSIRVDRRDVLSIQLDGERRRESDDLDIVVLLSGDEVSGRVELRQNGRLVAVVQRTGGEVTFDQRQVRTILWSHRAESEQKQADGGGIGRTVDRLLAQIAEGELKERELARSQLLDLGFFALPYLETRRGREGVPPEVSAAIEKAIQIAHLRSYSSSFLIERLPDLPRRLAADEPEVRLAALKEAVVASPRDCPPLLVHLARGEPASHVRAFILGQLSLMNRTQELAALLESEDASLRLAAALALGDNGVHVGIEYVIDALQHNGEDVRKVAIESLERWTGQFLGFFASDPEEKRAAAVERWRKWFEESGSDFVDQSLRATVSRDEVTAEEQDEGRVYWTKAQVLWQQILANGLEGEARKDEIRKVQFFLQKAIEKYPHFLNARLALAELYLTELDQTASARREIDVIMRRYAEDMGAGTRRAASYYLGLIAQREKRWLEAERHFRNAAAVASSDYRISRAMGRLSYERALSDASPVAEGTDAVPAAPEKPAGAAAVAKARIAALDASVAFFTEALAKLDAYVKEVEGSTSSADAAASEEMPFEAARFLNKLEAMKEHLKRERAELHFLRARSYAARQRDREAYADYLEAKKLQPGNVVYHGAVELWRARVEGKKNPAGPQRKPNTAKPRDDDREQ